MLETWNPPDAPIWNARAPSTAVGISGKSAPTVAT